MLLAIDSYEDFINIEGVAVSTVPSFQSACINGAKLDAPQNSYIDGNISGEKAKSEFSLASLLSRFLPYTIPQNFVRFVP